MIPRYQRILYWVLAGGSLLMCLILIRGCARDQQRIAAMRDQSPIAAPTDIPNEEASIARANDADGSVTLDTVTLPLPEEPSLRARILLDRTLADAALPASTHPVPAGAAVTDVFLLNLPIHNPAENSDFSSPNPFGPSESDLRAARQAALSVAPGSQLAVVNLTKNFADQHPSGIESEDLTLRALIATLHANLPQISQVRFLVDGKPRDTLNGHADLSRAYLIADPASQIHVLSADGSPL